MSAPSPAGHPSASLLAAYASGWISWSGDLCIRVHLGTCASCRAEVGKLELAEAEFVDALPEAPVTPETLEIAAKLKGTQVEAHLPRKRPTLGDVRLPPALDSAAIGRRRWLAPGFWLAPLPDGRAEGWRTSLLRAPAGLRVPGHRHVGPELICVLSGAFLEDEQRYAAGDFVESAGHSEHSLSVTNEGPCACLIAHKGRLRWRGAAKILGPLLSV